MRRCLARFRSESLGEVSHSDGHSVVNRQNKKPIHREIKNRRERCSRFKMMKLCIGSVNSETIYLLINHSASRFAFTSGAAKFSVAGSSVSSFILYLIGALVKEHIYYIRNLAGNQDFSSEVLHSL